MNILFTHCEPGFWQPPIYIANVGWTCWILGSQWQGWFLFFRRFGWLNKSQNDGNNGPPCFIVVFFWESHFEIFLRDILIYSPMFSWCHHHRDHQKIHQGRSSVLLLWLFFFGCFFLWRWGRPWFVQGALKIHSQAVFEDRRKQENSYR